MHFSTGLGWQEAVTSVRDLDRWIEALDYLAGWSVAHRGPADPRLLSAWGLPAHAAAEEAVVVCREDPSRWLRLMSFADIAQQQIRSSAQAWETGGLFSILAYTADTQAAFERAQQLGWSAYHDPVIMEFGERELLNVVLRGPDGCNFGLYQPLRPEPESAFPFAKVGPPFNGQQMILKLADTQSFYELALGWESWYSGETRLTCNNFGIPDNLVGVYPKQIAIMHAAQRHYGQVELVQWNGFEGRDFSDQAVPPNLGHLALRWPVADLETRLEQLEANSVPVLALTRCRLPPLGAVLLATLRTPDGVMIELVQSA